MKVNPMTACDYYKLGHMTMDVPGVKQVVSTWTPRQHKHDRHENRKTVVFGHQYVVKRYFQEFFKEFFENDFQYYDDDFTRKIQSTFNPRYIDPICRAFKKLHALGYLPIEVWALPEGTLVSDGCPQAMLFNTDMEFGWLPQFLEDLWSCHSWLPSTSATTAYYRRKTAEPYYENSDDPLAVRRLCGDFSLRGMTGHEAAAISGLGHLLSFDRTATIDANSIAEQYYGADLVNKPVGYGLPSLEHSVVEKGVAYFKVQIMEKGISMLESKYWRPLRTASDENWDINLMAEMCFMIYLLTEVQPEGNFTYVADTYDYWGVIEIILPVIKEIIMERDGKFIIRPDSGDPVHTVTKTIPILGNIFGYKYNKADMRMLNSHIGLIYGDAITAERQTDILNGLRQLGWAPENISLGIGAYTYQYVTRDTRGYAIKAVDCTIEFDEGEVELPIFKEPKTDTGKKSQRGAVVVFKTEETGGLGYWDGFPLKQALGDPFQTMRPIFRNGTCVNQETIYEIRDRLWNNHF